MNLARKEAQFSKTMIPSSILLFRYSALTFNSHKIHFDHEYATRVEKHPGKRRKKKKQCMEVALKLTFFIVLISVPCSRTTEWNAAFRSFKNA